MPPRKTATKATKAPVKKLAPPLPTTASNANRILFTKASDSFGCFSNFSPHPVTMPFPVEAIQTEEAKSSKAAASAKIHQPTAAVAGTSTSPVAMITFPTSEHYFQAVKFPPGSKAFFACVDAATPTATKKAGGNRKVPIRGDWNTHRHQVMLDVLTEKFGPNNTSLRDTLLSTGTAELVEHAAWDKYWGDGGNGSGQNHLGKALMHVRSALLAAEATKSSATAAAPQSVVTTSKVVDELGES